MDKGLILSVLLMVLSWEFMATYAQTTVPNNVTNSNQTVAPTNNTITMVPGNNTTAVGQGTNGTSAASANNATTVTAVTSGTTSATSNTTVPANTTTAASTTNIPALVANISRLGCRSKKLCAAEPSECDPATGNGCYFLSAKQSSGQSYDFELSGQSDGYIAAGLSTAANLAGSHRAYICVNNNGGVKFLTGTINNYKINLAESLNSSKPQGTVNAGKIQCTFTADLPDTKTRAASYALSVLTGTLKDGTLQTPIFRILTPRVNLSDPTVNLTNLLTTTSSAYLVTPTHVSFLPALLVTVCMLAFTAM